MTGMPELRRLRRESRMTRKALAAMLDVTDKTILNWETGKRNPDVLTLRRIAAALNTTVGALLGELPTSAGGAA